MISLLAWAGTAAADEPHAFGIGLELGAPTGLSAKYYFGRNAKGTLVAVQAGLGAIERYHDDGLHLHVDVLWHPAMLTRTPDFDMPFYLGVGARVLGFDDNEYCVRNGNVVVCDYYNDDTWLGVRVPFGILMDFKKVPIDAFFELAVVVDLIRIENHDDAYDPNHDRVDINGVLGARYYF